MLLLTPALTSQTDKVENTKSIGSPDENPNKNTKRPNVQPQGVPTRVLCSFPQQISRCLRWWGRRESVDVVPHGAPTPCASQGRPAGAIFLLGCSGSIIRSTTASIRNSRVRLAQIYKSS